MRIDGASPLFICACFDTRPANIVAPFKLAIVYWNRRSKKLITHPVMCNILVA